MTTSLIQDSAFRGQGGNPTSRGSCRPVAARGIGQHAVTDLKICYAAADNIGLEALLNVRRRDAIGRRNPAIAATLDRNVDAR